MERSSEGNRKITQQTKVRFTRIKFLVPSINLEKADQFIQVTPSPKLDYINISIFSSLGSGENTPISLNERTPFFDRNSPPV
jgi:hypothetical protein